MYNNMRTCVMPPLPPQENHHVAAAFMLLRHDDYNFLARSSDQVSRVG